MRSLVALLVVVLLGMTPVDLRASGAPSRSDAQTLRERDDRPVTREFIQDSGAISAKPAQAVGKVSSHAFPDSASPVAARMAGRVSRVAVPEAPFLARSPWVGVVELRI